MIADSISFHSCNMHLMMFFFPNMQDTVNVISLGNVILHIHKNTQSKTFCTYRRKSPQNFKQFSPVMSDRYGLFSLSGMESSVSGLPRPPEDAVVFSLQRALGDAGLNCGAQKTKVNFPQLLIRGSLQLVGVC